METNNGTLQIKRYNNRKLYSLETSAYITNKQVVEAVLAGRNVKVTSRDGSDITSQILAQAIVSVVSSGEMSAVNAQTLSNNLLGAIRGLDALAKSAVGQ
jgi:polyhydroxyalkanoate synthesis regulator protein